MDAQADIPKFLRRLAAPDKLPHNSVMTTDRLRWCLDQIRWSQRQLARELGIGETTVRKWARGTVPIPPEVGPWLEALAAVHAAMPKPNGWRSGGAKNA